MQTSRASPKQPFEAPQFSAHHASSPMLLAATYPRPQNSLSPLPAAATLSIDFAGAGAGRLGSRPPPSPPPPSPPPSVLAGFTLGGAGNIPTGDSPLKPSYAQKIAKCVESIFSKFVCRPLERLPPGVDDVFAAAS